jgi:D-serine deaminase-like pyridoxal phosphate-dependent protein
VQAGAVGVCVATISEMTSICAAGIGVLLTTPVASRNKTSRVAALTYTGADIRVVVDHPDQARMYQESAERSGTVIKVLVDLDIGDHRTGIPCDERAIGLARQIAAFPNLQFAGLQAYSVSGSCGAQRTSRSSTHAIASHCRAKQMWPQVSTRGL